MEQQTITRSTLAWVTVSKRFCAFFMTALLLFGGSAAAAERVYQKPSEFIFKSLGKIPPTQVVKLSSAQQKNVRAILGKRYKTTSIRHWTVGQKTAFILEEIGKTEYITTGFVVSGGEITTVKVLVYRESHGWEVARTSFTKQFKSAKLGNGNQLDCRIKNVAGATLSVRALTKLSRLALYLDAIK